MTIKFKKKFLFELAKVPQHIRKEIEEFVFEQFPANPSPSRWQNIVPLKQDASLYKILFNEFRIGLRRTDRNLVFERIRHRNDIYRIQS